jgi:hypothetical protein
MSYWQEQIEKDKQDRKNSVLFNLNLNKEREQLLEKGMLSEYGGLSQLPLSKKGSEIKEKLQLERVKAGQALISVSEKLINLKKEIGIEPVSIDYDEKESIDSLKTYEYEQMNQNEGGSVSKEVTSKMREYNNCAYKYKTLKKEVKFLNTLIEGIQDGKTYELSVRVLSELGF